MNKISDELILKRINTAYEILTKEYGDNRILGVFAKGNANYGFAENVYDFSLIAVYLPSFEDLCTTTPTEWYFTKPSWSSMNWKDEIYIYDIRLFYTAAEHIGDTSLELLYAYKIINPIYENVFNNYLIDKRELIGKLNVPGRICKTRNRILQAINLKNSFEAMRLYISIQNYIDGKSLEECFRPTDLVTQYYLWDFKDGEELPKNFQSDMFDKFSEYLSECTYDFNFEADKALREGIIALLEKGLKSNIAEDSFLKNLSNLEKDALKYILSHLDSNLKGDVSISKLTTSSGISRPVFSNVLIKLTKFNMADVKNRGAKGTHIEFYNKNFSFEERIIE